MSEVICYSQIKRRLWCQEIYETAAPHADRRARALRKAGYVVVSNPWIGHIGKSILTITPGSHETTFGLPDVKMGKV